MRISLGKAIILGIAIRMILALYTTHPGTYAKTAHLDQFFILGSDPLVRATSFGPSFYLFYVPFYLLYWLMAHYLGLNYDFLLNMLMKVPPLVGDVITTYALYHLGLGITKSPSTARFLALSYFLNPYVIWITGIVGHAESLWVGLVVLSMVCLLRDDLTKSAVSLGIATSFRELPLLILPFFLYFVYRGRLALGRFSGLYLAAVLLLSIPYALTVFQIYVGSPPQVAAFLEHFVGAGSAVQGTGGYGIDSIKTFTFNFTGLMANLGMWPALSWFFGFRSFLIVFAATAICIMIRGQNNVVWLNRCIIVTFGMLLMFTPLVQHEYLSWILPSLLFEVVVARGLPSFVPFLLATTTLLIDPLTQGAFFNYSEFAFLPNASLLADTWPLNVVLIYGSISALHALTVLFSTVAAFVILMRGGSNIGQKRTA